MPDKHVARRRFGQNFLVDGLVIDAIVRAINPRPGDRLVEIGPGLGALTQPLCRALGDTPLHVVELDRDLVARLHRGVLASHLVVHEADALRFDFSTLTPVVPLPPIDPPPAPALRVCGNLPYNISSPLLFHLADFAGLIRDQHFMLQKEVVERMVAAPGSKDYGRLSVMLQVRYAMTLLFIVPPTAFDPAPKVESAVVRMIPLAQPAVSNALMPVFAALVAQAFSQRRKMLRNTLRDYAAQLEQVGITPTARAEEVAVADYVALARLLPGTLLS